MTNNTLHGPAKWASACRHRLRSVSRFVKRLDDFVFLPGLGALITTDVSGIVRDMNEIGTVQACSKLRFSNAWTHSLRLAGSASLRWASNAELYVYNYASFDDIPDEPVRKAIDEAPRT